MCDSVHGSVFDSQKLKFPYIDVISTFLSITIEKDHRSDPGQINSTPQIVLI